MGTNTLNTAYANGEIIDASHPNELTLALTGAFVGRDANGIPSPGQQLGTLAIPWGSMFTNAITINGQALDTSQIVTAANRVISGQSRASSSLPDFIRAAGASLNFTVEAATTDLNLSVNNSSVNVSTDLLFTGMTAAPSTNNTALVNDVSMSGDLYAGEDGSEITVDAVGTEISSRIGEQAVFKTPAGEYFIGFIKSATVISNVYRGFFFSSAGATIPRAALSNNDSLEIMSTGWVFLEDNGVTLDVTYTTPIYSFNAPSSPQTGDYWFDISVQAWKRYSGASFVIINRVLIGMAVADTTNCIASRSLDFTNNFSLDNNIDLEIFSTAIIRSKDLSIRANVYGSKVVQDNNKLDFNITTDLESGQIEGSSKLYYLYLSDKGERVISDIRPHNRKDLKGRYHPFNSWRYIGEAFNNSSGDFSIIRSDARGTSNSEKSFISDQRASGTQGGAIVTGVWTTRILNTISSDPARIAQPSVDLVSNQITLLKGVYHVQTDAPLYASDNHKTRFYNVTKAATSLVGTSEFADNINSGAQTRSFVSGTIRVTSPFEVFELQHRSAITTGASGMGLASVSGEDEVFARVNITKIEEK